MLTRDAAYESLLRGRRQALHRIIAEALVQRFPATVANEPEIVAHHYTRAGLTEQAIPHWLHAGERAVAASANAEASHHFECALELLKELPEDEERDRMELPLRLGLASALHKMAYQEAGIWRQILLPGRTVPEPSLLRTHPETGERVRRLLDLAGTDSPGWQVPLDTGTPRQRTAGMWLH